MKKTEHFTTFFFSSHLFVMPLNDIIKSVNNFLKFSCIIKRFNCRLCSYSGEMWFPELNAVLSQLQTLIKI